MTARISTNGNTAIVGLWIEEGNFALYLVSRTTCKVGLSCGGIFSLLSPMGISTFNPDVRVFIAQCWMGGRGGCERTCSILRYAPLLTK